VVVSWWDHKEGKYSGGQKIPGVMGYAFKRVVPAVRRIGYGKCESDFLGSGFFVYRLGIDLVC
jgi:hypothetical protein